MVNNELRGGQNVMIHREVIRDLDEQQKYLDMIENNEPLPSNISYSVDFTYCEGEETEIYTFYKNLNEKEVEEKIKLETMQSLKSIADSMKFFKCYIITMLCLWGISFFILLIASCSGAI